MTKTKAKRSSVATRKRAARAVARADSAGEVERSISRLDWTDEQSKGLASIAQAFFERGVSNYIGSGWPVNDQQATKLARTFYEVLLTGRPICDALKAGREKISDYGHTWGAYQQYGTANDVVLSHVDKRQD